MDVSRILSYDQSRETALKICLQKLKVNDQRIVKHSLDKLIPDLDSSFVRILIEICEASDKLMECRSKINEMLEEAANKLKTPKTKQGIQIELPEEFIKETMDWRI